MLRVGEYKCWKVETLGYAHTPRNSKCLCDHLYIVGKVVRGNLWPLVRVARPSAGDDKNPNWIIFGDAQHSPTTNSFSSGHDKINHRNDQTTCGEDTNNVSENSADEEKFPKKAETK